MTAFLRTAVAEGATPVGSANAQPWWDKTMTNANHVNPVQKHRAEKARR